jgi:polyphosphate kinase
MQRNFDRRVEIVFPVIDAQLQAKLKNILEIQLEDNVKGWLAQPDGSYSRNRAEGKAYLRCQERLYDAVQAEDGGPPSPGTSSID